MVHSLASDELASCKKTVSERLNSRAMSCFCSWVSFVPEGRATTASGLPV